MVANLGGTTASVTGGGLGSVALPRIETLNLNAGAANLTLAGTSGPDAFTITATAPDTATAQVGTLSPVVNTSNNSERVILSKYGRMTNADSIPTKMLAAPHSDSAPLIFIVRWKIND